MEKEKLYYDTVVDEYIYYKMDKYVECEIKAGRIREVSEYEKKDISFIVSEEYVSFFNNSNSVFKVPCEKTATEPAYFANCDYPKIMWDFWNDLSKAYCIMMGFSGGTSGIWPSMREKYLNGKEYAKPEEMIAFLNKFDNKQVLEFLFYCVRYAERFGCGSYAKYAEEGIIGKLLNRLKQLPLSIEPFDICEYNEMLKKE